MSAMVVCGADGCRLLAQRAVSSLPAGSVGGGRGVGRRPGSGPGNSRGRLRRNFRGLWQI